MKLINEHAAPSDAQDRRDIKPVVCYPPETLIPVDLDGYRRARDTMRLIETIVIPARSAKTFEVKAGQFFRIVSIHGPQVGDLNLHSADDLTERFFSGKTRALHGTHVSTGDRAWSSIPFLRPMATITGDTLDWYGFDAFGGSVHDVIGTRCDPYTHALLSDGGQYHYCCHSNLSRSLGEYMGKDPKEIEHLVHDVMNVFMCTGFTRDTQQYFMKSSPVRPGDYLEFFAEMDLVGNLSACPGGDCSTSHSSDVAACHPLQVEIYDADPVPNWTPAKLTGYDRTHGLG